MALHLKSISISIRAICIVIFVWQFYLLTQNYQQFNVRKEVTYYIPNEIELPEIRILIPYQFALDPVFLQTKYKSHFDEICGHFSDKKDCVDKLKNPLLFTKSFGPHLLLSDIKSHSYLPEVFLQQLGLAGFKEDTLKTGKCKLISQASSSFLLLSLKCLNSSGLPLTISRAESIVYNASYLFGFKLNSTAMLMNLIYPEKALVEDDSFYAHSSLTPGKQNSHGIRFTKHTVNLLPPPYKTMCKNYDRRQVFEDCLNAHSIEQTGMLFPGTSVPFNNYSESSQMRFNAMLHNDNGTLRKIYEQCQSFVTQPMCNSVCIYSVYVLSMYVLSMYPISSTTIEVPKGKESISLHFMVSSEFDSVTESKPEFPLFDYLILSASLFSSWFGISLMGQLLVASDLFTLVVQRKRTAVLDEHNQESESGVRSG